MVNPGIGLVPSASTDFHIVFAAKHSTAICSRKSQNVRTNRLPRSRLNCKHKDVVPIRSWPQWDRYRRLTHSNLPSTQRPTCPLDRAPAVKHEQAVTRIEDEPFV